MSADAQQMVASTSTGEIWTSELCRCIPKPCPWRCNILLATDSRPRPRPCPYHSPAPGSDYGQTWTQMPIPGVPSGQTWTSVASNSDFTVLEATAANGAVWRSTDGGINWSNASSPPSPAAWTCVSSSANGSFVLAADQGGQLWLSTDGGLNWTAQTQPGASGVGNWSAVSVSKVGEAGRGCRKGETRGGD